MREFQLSVAKKMSEKEEEFSSVAKKMSEIFCLNNSMGVKEFKV